MHENVELIGDTVHIFIPMNLKRRSARKEIILPGEKSEPVRPLVQAVARAYAWQKWLDEGKFASARGLAKHVGLHYTVVARTLRLAGLAPDVVESILDGEEPEGLSLEKLRSDIPLLWEKQRKSLGVSHR